MGAAYSEGLLNVGTTTSEAKAGVTVEAVQSKLSWRGGVPGVDEADDGDGAKVSAEEDESKEDPEDERSETGRSEKVEEVGDEIGGSADCLRLTGVALCRWMSSSKAGSTTFALSSSAK